MSTITIRSRILHTLGVGGGIGIGIDGRIESKSEDPEGTRIPLITEDFHGSEMLSFLICEDPYDPRNPCSTPVGFLDASGDL